MKTMTNQPKVSICVPTYNRPELIAQCIDSCLAQTHANIEVVIGDDSKDNRTRDLIATRYAHDARVRYQRNEPSLGQARNVASLFARATGDKILLIHDDDYLAVEGVERLLAPWQTHPDLDVAFGNQYEVALDGTIDIAVSDRLNADFHRVKEAAGIQPLAGRTGLIQMFPNNGWLANADLVKRVGYHEEYGMCCDYAFGVELCVAARQVCYVHEYVSYYRKTEVSISANTRGSTTAASVSAYAFVAQLKLPLELEPARRIALRRIVPIVVSVYAKNGRAWAGLRIALAHLYAYNYGFSARFAYHVAMLARATVSAKPKSKPPASDIKPAAPSNNLPRRRLDKPL